MSDEFDDAMDLPAVAGAHGADSHTEDPAARGASARACRLVARLFASAGTPLRVRLLGCLMRPLGPLGAAGVAAGAFAVFPNPPRGIEPRIDPTAVAGVSASQVHELARFVQQVDPQALQQFAGLVAGSPVSQAPFGATTLVLLYRELQPALAVPPG